MGGVNNFAPGGMQAPQFTPNTPAQWGNMGRAGMGGPVQASNSSNQTPAPRGDIVTVAQQIARQVQPRQQTQQNAPLPAAFKGVSLEEFQKLQQQMRMQDPMYASLSAVDADMQSRGGPSLFQGGGKQ